MNSCCIKYHLNVCSYGTCKWGWGCMSRHSSPHFLLWKIKNKFFHVEGLFSSYRGFFFSLCGWEFFLWRAFLWLLPLLQFFFAAPMCAVLCLFVGLTTWIIVGFHLYYYKVDSPQSLCTQFAFAY